MSDWFTGTLCACLGPQMNDPFCPCHMRREGMDGYYNCYGDKTAMAKREAEAQERLRVAMADFGRKMESRDERG